MSQMARLSSWAVMQRAAANSVTTIIEGISHAVGNAFPIIWEHSSWQMPLFAFNHGSTSLPHQSRATATFSVSCTIQADATKAKRAQVASSP